MGTTKSNLGSYLASEGLRPEETDFGFVFKYQNLTFFIFWDDDDNHYLGQDDQCGLRRNRRC